MKRLALRPAVMFRPKKTSAPSEWGEEKRTGWGLLILRLRIRI